MMPPKFSCMRLPPSTWYYCNSLLYGVSQYQMDLLHRVLNAAARVTCLLPRYSHITPVLINLHWLPVAFRVKFKIALIVFKALKGKAPSYLIELLHAKTPGRYALLSDRKHLLTGPPNEMQDFWRQVICC